MLEQLYAYKRNIVHTTIKTRAWWYYIKGGIYVPMTVPEIPSLNGIDYINIKKKKNITNPWNKDKWTPQEYRERFCKQHINGRWYWKGYEPY